MENEDIVDGIPTETTESEDDFFSEIDEQVMLDE